MARKPLTKKEYDALSTAERMKLYDKVAKQEGRATGQKEIAGGPLPTDMEERLTSKAYAERGRFGSTGIAGARNVSDKEIRAEKEREARLKKWIKDHPNEPLPPHWDKGYSKGGGVFGMKKPVKKAVGGVGKLRKGMCDKPAKLAKGGAGKVRKGMMTPEGKIIDVMNKIRGK